MNSSVGLHRIETNFGNVNRSQRRVPIVGLVLFALLAGTGRSSTSAQQQALLLEGGIRAGRLTGTSPAALAFVAENEGEKSRAGQVPLGAIRQIRFVARPRLVSGIAPPRRMVFFGGESWHAGLAAIEEREAAVSIFDASLIPVPRGALACLLQATGARSLVYEDFEERPTLFEGARLSPVRHRSGRQSLARRPGDGMASFTIPRPISAGRIELSFYDSGAVDPTQEWFIEVEMGKGAQATIFRFCPGWRLPDYRCEVLGHGRLAAQLVARSPGWRRFTLLFDAERTIALVDGKVVGTGAGGQAPGVIRLNNVSAAPSGNATDATARKGEAKAEGWIDDLQISEQVGGRSIPSNTQQNDLLWLADGDELFGRLITVSPREATLDVRSGRRRFPWSELNGIVFARVGAPSGAPVDGWIATIELAPILGAGPGSNDRIIAALQQVSESTLIAAHPYLGTLRIPLGEIERIVPQFCGSFRLLDPAEHHLGNEIREDFSAKLAEGPHLERSFALDAIPRQGLSVSLMAIDLEPALSQVDRFRRELAAGHLRTDLFVNGRHVTDLNKHASWRASPSNPQRLRIAIPRAMLRTGENTLRIEQQPSQDDPREFDDCEISRLGIEIDSVTR